MYVLERSYMEHKTYAMQVQGLRKKFKEKTVLNGVDFQVEKGTIFSLLGSNGAGKTTTIKILTTLLQPDEGEVLVDGFDVSKDIEKIHEQISLTGQFAAVDEALTGMENLMMMAKLYHIKEPKKEVQRLLSYFSLETAQHKKVSMYSGGMRRKLDIAMSLIHKPSIIFLDEPTTGLDPQSRRAMWAIVKELKKQGVTIFLTTQYLEEAEELADHIAFLHEGKIIKNGTPQQLKSILPKHVLELQLSNLISYEKTINLLNQYQLHMEETSWTVSITLQDVLNELLEILQQIKQADIQVQDFRWKQTTMEDVFMKMIGKEQAYETVDK